MEFAEETGILPAELLRQFSVIKHLLHSGLGIIEIAFKRNNVRIAAFLRHHLFFLDRADAVLRVKTMIFVPGTSANPASAAFPVSPEVAVRITMSFFT